MKYSIQQCTYSKSACDTTNQPSLLYPPRPTQRASRPPPPLILPSPGAPSSPAPLLPSALPKAVPSPSSPSRDLLPNLQMSNSVLLAAAISVPLSLLLALCLAVRRCRKRGRGPVAGEPRRAKEWSVGDILGRNKDGFKPLNTEEKDGMLDDDSDSEVPLAQWRHQIGGGD